MVKNLLMLIKKIFKEWELKKKIDFFRSIKNPKTLIERKGKK